MTTDSTLIKAPLGKKSPYISHYDPTLLFPIPRAPRRTEINITQTLPFQGVDNWTAFELSWLNSKGKPVVALAEFNIPCDSPNLIEAKSLKLYFNSFNLSKFSSDDAVKNHMESDLSQATGSKIAIKLIPIAEYSTAPLTEWSGIYLDSLDISTDVYDVNPAFLQIETSTVTETVFSHILKSNCLVTGQPDWGSLLIRYQGKKINHQGLLKYTISFRNHTEFGEHCVERIFMDIMQHCQPEKLTVYARYTRRGGLDLNPFRSNFEQIPAHERLNRQ